MLLTILIPYFKKIHTPSSDTNILGIYGYCCLLINLMCFYLQ